jgi:hypothetical protein
MGLLMWPIFAAFTSAAAVAGLFVIPCRTAAIRNIDAIPSCPCTIAGNVFRFSQNSQAREVDIGKSANRDGAMRQDIP